MVEVGTEEADLGGQLGILRGFPFALLHHHCSVGHEFVAAGMVEMQVAVYDEVDLAGIAVDRFQPRLHVVVCPELLEAEDACDPLAQPAGRVGTALRMHAGIEHRPAPRMFDQVGGNGQRDLAVLALDHVLEAADEPAAGHGVELDGHVRRRALFSAARSRPSDWPCRRSTSLPGRRTSQTAWAWPCKRRAGQDWRRSPP